jgi:hypothetical protein
MIDAEVVRLRRLRDAALRTRQFAIALGADSRDSNSVFSRTAIACWRMASIATGRLRAHPYLSYQRGTSVTRILHDRALSAVVGGIARYRGRRLRTLAAQLRLVERELNDTRALTWLLELSDTLGRAQAQLRRLIKEVEHGAWKEAGSPVDAPSQELLATGREDAAAVAGNWPYLAF